MDEVVHHCLKELAFDGDLGCDVSRLKDFIVGFYDHNCRTVTAGQLKTSNEVISSFPPKQNLDDSFYAYVWSLVIQQPDILVGLVPPGPTSEVYIAPRTSAKRKAKAKGEEHVEVEAPKLTLIPEEERRLSMVELKGKYGDRLRIALAPDAVFRAVTGSHIRDAKMTPMVYSTLQIITRGRDAGVSVISIGQQTGYDQKTCFYLVKQLSELNLVLKVRKGGVSTNFCIHKYFFERSPAWQAIRGEEMQAEEEETPIRRDNATTEDEGSTIVDPSLLDFSSIDGRHLSSLPIVKSRMIKLLKASKNYIHVSQNVLIKLGFANPKKTDRRFFHTRIRELVHQGVIEKVLVPHKVKKSLVKCYRLVTPDNEAKNAPQGMVQDIEDDTAKDEEELATAQNGIKLNITIYKQIIDIIEESEMTGLTLNELSAALYNFDKRTIELFLSRAEKSDPPVHLSDLGVVGVMESSGRERRHRYYTISSYRSLVAKEKLDDKTASYLTNLVESEPDSVGGFASFNSSEFYQSPEQLIEYQNKGKPVVTKGFKRRKKALKNPIMPDGTVKLGRPRKYPIGEAPAVKRKRAREEAAASGCPPTKKVRIEENVGAVEMTESTPKKRGRPRLKSAEEGTYQPTKPTKRRGRPPKYGAAEDVEEGSQETPQTKKHGRPQKRPAEEDINPPSISDGISVESVTQQEAPRRDASSTWAPGQLFSGQDSAMTTPSMIPPLATPKRRGRPPKKPRLEGVEPPASAMTEPLASHAEVNMNNVPESSTPVIPASTIPMRIDLLNLGTQSRRALTDKTLETPDTENGLPDQAMILESPICLTSAGESQPPVPLVDPCVVQLTSPPTPAAITLSSIQRPIEAVIDPVLLAEEAFNARVIASAPSEDLRSKEMTLTSEASPLTIPLSVKPPKAQKQADNKSERSKVNVSHMRRENEFQTLLHNAGGILNVSVKDFGELHVALLDKLAKEGGPMSAPPGTRVDKRTMNLAFSNLEQRGRVRTLRTTLLTITGIQKPTTIIYLPTVPQEELNKFLANLSRSSNQVPNVPRVLNFIKLDEKLEYGKSPAPPRAAMRLSDTSTPSRKRRPPKNKARVDELLKEDDEVIRKVLLAEQNTIGQKYGFVVRRIPRAQKLHLATIDAFTAGASSDYIISHEKRIIDLNYFFQEIPLKLHVSFVNDLVDDDELVEACKNFGETLLKDLPNQLTQLLHLNQSRSRYRLLENFEVLKSLKLVTPLQASKSNTPWITCAPKDGHPTVFDVTTFKAYPANGAPRYWHFSSIAPVYICFKSGNAPPFYKDVSLATPADAIAFWQMLKDACISDTLTPDPNRAESILGPFEATSLVRTLRNAQQWSFDYSFTWHQAQYMKQFIDLNTGYTPLQQGEPEASQRLENISSIVGAPVSAIKAYYEDARMNIIGVLTKAGQVLEPNAGTMRKVRRHIQKRTDEKASLARKAAEARAQRELQWEELVQDVSPGGVKGTIALRLGKLRTKFLSEGLAGDQEKWNVAIRQTIKEAELASKQVLSLPRKSRGLPTAQGSQSGPQAVTNPPGKSLQLLIQQQGPPIIEERRKKKREDFEALEGSAPTSDSTPRQRRQRFYWTREYDELACDAYVIIRVRCRHLSKVEWGAYSQVFPAVPRNSVRQRVSVLKMSPGAEGYLKRLENKFFELWTQYRGTQTLPDDDPASPSNFDLVKHIEFLRMYVDKNAVRLGIDQGYKKTIVNLPSSVEAIKNNFDVQEDLPSAPTWDFLWNSIIEEGKERELLVNPFVRHHEEIALHSKPTVTDLQGVAEAALKMVFGTPNERYDPEAASKLLHDVGEEPIAAASKDMLNQGILSKLVRDPTKPRPGRQLKISDSNAASLGGPISSDAYQDAFALEEMSLQEDRDTWREWPLLATDGDMAALIHLVSEDRVEFEIDTTQARLARPALDWNSKKADDDHIETLIKVRYSKSTALAEIAVTETPIVTVDENEGHNDTVAEKRRATKEAEPERPHQNQANSLLSHSTRREKDHGNYIGPLSNADAISGSATIKHDRQKTLSEAALTLQVLTSRDGESQSHRQTWGGETECCCKLQWLPNIAGAGTSLLGQDTVGSNENIMGVDIDGGSVATYNTTNHIGDFGVAADSPMQRQLELVDCEQCLAEELTHQMKNMMDSDEERRIAMRLLEVIQLAGPSGLTSRGVKAAKLDQAWSSRQICQVISKLLLLPPSTLSRTRTPLCFWAGYSETTIVSAKFLRQWGVIVACQGDEGPINRDRNSSSSGINQGHIDTGTRTSVTLLAELPKQRVLPRRWLDINGSVIGGFWQAALRAVIGLIAFRPGITEAELRWRLRLIYNRQEIKELLEHLAADGSVKSHGVTHPLVGGGVCEWLNGTDGKMVFWSINEGRAWYQV